MRADKFFADKFGSRTKSAEALEKGWVLINGRPVRPKDEVRDTDDVVFIEPETRFVSNGGYKLERAFKAFEIDCRDKVFADIGASTGGFTDCLLQRGAKRVYAIDVGESLLHESLQGREEICIMDNTNARYLTKADFLERLDGIVTDVSFISLRLIFPVVASLLEEDGQAFVLIKPQFECENKRIGKSGIVHTSAHVDIVKKVLGYAKDNGLFVRGVVNAPVRKGKNIEYVLWLARKGINAKSDIEIIEWIKGFIKNDASVQNE